MAYFEQNDRGRQGYTRKFSSAQVAPTEETEEYGDYDDGFDDGYDDGFDELMEEEPEEEIPEEVRLREVRSSVSNNSLCPSRFLFPGASRHRNSSFPKYAVPLSDGPHP